MREFKWIDEFEIGDGIVFCGWKGIVKDIHKWQARNKTTLIVRRLDRDTEYTLEGRDGHDGWEAFNVGGETCGTE